MKFKDGYFSFSNGYITWFFIDLDLEAVSHILNKNPSTIISDLDKLCILSIANETGKCIKSAWPNSIHTEFDLINHLNKLSK